MTDIPSHSPRTPEMSDRRETICNTRVIFFSLRLSPNVSIAHRHGGDLLVQDEAELVKVHFEDGIFVPEESTTGFAAESTTAAYLRRHCWLSPAIMQSLVMFMPLQTAEKL
jgi:hypothetical protein